MVYLPSLFPVSEQEFRNSIGAFEHIAVQRGFGLPFDCIEHFDFL